MVRRNSVEIVLEAQDRASKEIDRAVKKTTREFSSLNRSLRGVGLNSDQIGKINSRIKEVNPRILEREMQNVRDKLKQLGLSSAEIKKITDEMKDAEKETEQVDKETKKATKSYGKFGNVAQKAGQMAKGAMVTAAAAIGASLVALTGAVGKFGIDYNATMEQSQVAWKTLLGTQEKAQKMLKDITDFTKSTPFETKQVDMMAKYMHNAGLEGKKLFSELRKASDVSSAFTIPAAEAKEMVRQMSQVRQAGVAYTEDLNILQDRGVPIFKAIAEQQGIMVKDVKKLASQGKLTSDVYISAFNSIAKSAEGASEAQSKTFNGMISTLKDNLSIFAGQIMKPTFDRLKDMMSGAVKQVETLNQAFKNGGWDGIFKKLIPPNIANAFSKVKDALTGFFDWYKSTIASAFSGDGNLGQSFTRIFNVIKSVAVPILQDAVQFIKDQLAGLKAFWDENGAQYIQAVKNVWNVIAKVFEAIAPVLLFIVKMVFESIKGVIDGALKVIMGLMKVFAGLFTGDMGKMWEGIKQLFVGAIETIWNVLNLMFIGRIIKGIGALVKGGVTLIKNFGSSIISTFKATWDNAWQHVDDFGKAIQELFNLFKARGTSTFKSFWNVIKSILTSMKDGSVGIFNKLKSSALSIFQAVKNAITKPIQTAKDLILEFIKSIKKGFTDLKKKAISWGEDIVNGLVDGIANKISAGKDKALQLAEGISATIKGFFGIRSPSKLMRQYGNWIGDGLIDGMFQKIPKAKQTAEELAKAVADAAKAAFDKSKEWIDQRKYYNQLSLVDELNAWQRVQARYKKGTDERIETEREVYRVKQEMFSKVKQINDDYLANVKQVNQQVIDDEKRLTDQYEQALSRRKDALYSFTGLFDEFKPNKATGKGLLDNLKNQIVGFKDWQKNIKELSKKGIDEGLLKELKDMGPKAAGEISALNSLSKEKLNEYASLWQEKHRLAKEESVQELRSLKYDTERQIDDLRVASAKKLDSLRDEWAKKIQEIRTGTKNEFEGLAKDMPGLGDGIMQGLLDGINGKKDALFTELSKISGRISQVMSGVGDIVMPKISGGKSVNPTMSANQKIIAAKQAYQAAANKGDRAAMEAARTSAAAARKAGGTIGADVTLQDALKKMPGLADGGTVVRGGLTLVGERGPEILNLPRSSQVVPLDKTSNNTYYVTLNLNTDDLNSMQKIIRLFEQLPQTVRQG